MFGVIVAAVVIILMLFAAISRVMFKKRQRRNMAAPKPERVVYVPSISQLTMLTKARSMPSDSPIRMPPPTYHNAYHNDFPPTYAEAAYKPEAIV